MLAGACGKDRTPRFFCAKCCLDKGRAVSYTKCNPSKTESRPSNARKRRVARKIRHREPGTVETGTEGSGEDGLGAARLTATLAQAATGAPVSAQEYGCTP